MSCLFFSFEVESFRCFGVPGRAGKATGEGEGRGVTREKHKEGRRNPECTRSLYRGSDYFDIGSREDADTHDRLLLSEKSDPLPLGCHFYVVMKHMPTLPPTLSSSYALSPLSPPFAIHTSVREIPWAYILCVCLRPISHPKEEALVFVWRILRSFICWGNVWDSRAMQQTRDSLQRRYARWKSLSRLHVLTFSTYG